VRGVEQAVRTLLDASSDGEACLVSMAALEAATLRNANTHKRIFSLGGARVISTVMAEHLRDARIQPLACRTLQHLAASGHEDAATQLAQAGACAAARFAMDAHASDTLLQQVACHALELMVFGSSEARSQAVTDGAVEAVLKALKAHRKDIYVSQASLASLQAMIEDGPDCHQRIKKEGGVAVVIGALAEHRENPQTQYWGKLLLQGLCVASPELRTEVLRKCHFQGIEVELPS